MGPFIAQTQSYCIIWNIKRSNMLKQTHFETNTHHSFSQNQTSTAMPLCVICCFVHFVSSQQLTHSFSASYCRRNHRQTWSAGRDVNTQRESGSRHIERMTCGLFGFTTKTTRRQWRRTLSPCFKIQLCNNRKKLGFRKKNLIFLAWCNNII